MEQINLNEILLEDFEALTEDASSNRSVVSPVNTSGNISVNDILKEDNANIEENKKAFADLLNYYIIDYKTFHAGYGRLLANHFPKQYQQCFSSTGVLKERRSYASIKQMQIEIPNLVIDPSQKAELRAAQKVLASIIWAGIYNDRFAGVFTEVEIENHNQIDYRLRIQALKNAVSKKQPIEINVLLYLLTGKADSKTTLDKLSKSTIEMIVSGTSSNTESETFEAQTETDSISKEDTEISEETEKNNAKEKFLEIYGGKNPLNLPEITSKTKEFITSFDKYSKWIESKLPKIKTSINNSIEKLFNTVNQKNLASSEMTAELNSVIQSIHSGTYAGLVNDSVYSRFMSPSTFAFIYARPQKWKETTIKTETAEGPEIVKSIDPHLILSKKDFETVISSADKVNMPAIVKEIKISNLELYAKTSDADSTTLLNSIRLPAPKFFSKLSKAHILFIKRIFVTYDLATRLEALNDAVKSEEVKKAILQYIYSYLNEAEVDDKFYLSETVISTRSSAHWASLRYPAELFIEQKRTSSISISEIAGRLKAAASHDTERLLEDIRQEISNVSFDLACTYTIGNKTERKIVRSVEDKYSNSKTNFCYSIIKVDQSKFLEEPGKVFKIEKTFHNLLTSPDAVMEEILNNFGKNANLADPNVRYYAKYYDESRLGNSFLRVFNHIFNLVRPLVVKDIRQVNESNVVLTPKNAENIW